MIRDLPGWPPVWAISYTGAEPHRTGEIGTLHEVEPGRSGATLLITIDLGDQRTSGVLSVGRELADRTLKVLRAHRGRPLTEVGGAEIPEDTQEVSR